MKYDVPDSEAYCLATAKLISALSSVTTLKKLDFYKRYEFSMSEISALSTLIQSSTSLKKLGLLDCTMNADMTGFLADAFQNNHSLTDLALDLRRLDYSQLMGFLSGIQDLQTVSRLKLQLKLEEKDQFNSVLEKLKRFNGLEQLELAVDIPDVSLDLINAMECERIKISPLLC